MLVFRSIKTKILISFFVVVLIPFLLLAFVSYDTISRELNNEINNNLLLLAEAKEGQVFAYLDFLEARTLDFASDGFIRDALSSQSTSYDYQLAEQIDSAMHEKKALDANLYGILLLDNNGRVVASTDREEIGANESGDEYFLEGRVGYYVGYIEHKHFGSDKILVTSAPIYDRDQNLFLGVVVNYFSLEKLQSVLSGTFQQKKGALSYKGGMRQSMNVFIVDDNYNAFAVSDNTGFGRDQGIAIKNADIVPVKACLEERREVLQEYQNFNNLMVKGASMCILKYDWTLVVEIEKDHITRIINQAQNKTISIVMGIVILILIMAWYISDLLTSPIEELSIVAKNIGEGRLATRSHNNAQDEIGALSQAFNKMADRIQKNAEITKKEIESKTEHLESLNEAMIGRELKMAKLKKDILGLKKTRKVQKK